MRNALKVINDINTELAGTPRNEQGEAYIALVRAFSLVKIENEEKNATALTVMEKLMLYMNEFEAEIDLEVVAQIRAYMDVLGNLIQEFESRMYPREKVSGHEMLGYLMERHSLNQTDLAEELGGQSVVSQILHGKRELNLRQIRALSKRFNVSPEVFVG